MRTEIERYETRKRKSQNAEGQTAWEQTRSQFKSALEGLAREERECQVEQAGAENQSRTDEAKMNDLQDQLDRFDKFLAGIGRK